MTFPVLAANSHGNTSATSSHNITVPACAIGDLIIAIACVDNSGSGGTTSVADFATLFNASEGGGFNYAYLAFRVVDGSESWYNAGAGGNAAMTHGGSALCTWHVLRVTGATEMEFSWDRTTVTDQANPPSLTPASVTGDILWIAAATFYGDPTLSSGPSGYTSVSDEGVGTSFIGAKSSVYKRNLNAASEDPTAFSSTPATRWVAFTIAVGTPVGVTPPVEGPPYVPPGPGAAILEIYAAEAGAARWGQAHWGQDVWSSAGWQDITSEGVDVEILWGSQRPELGILSQPDPASWAISLYDPERTLDPANAEGPYYGDLQPGLPVRLSHGGTVVKQGVAESIGYAFSETFGEKHTAQLRVTDILSVLGNARVPDDVTLSDTLFARARDAISAAGLVVTVLGDPPGGDPALAGWVTGTDYSALDWIMDAAQSVLWVPYVTNVGHLGFRPYQTPLDRGRVLASPNLVGLQSIIQHNGVYSVVSALNDPDTGVYTTREITPKPRYGARTYVRSTVTPDPGDWANAVLRDRGNAGLRWVPGEVYPLTAEDVALFAGIEAVESVGLVYLEASPAIIEEVIVVGGRITVIGKKGSEAVWSFSFEAAQAATPPLVTEDLLDLMVRDDDPTEYLYPDA